MCVFISPAILTDKRRELSTGRCPSAHSPLFQNKPREKPQHFVDKKRTRGFKFGQVSMGFGGYHIARNFVLHRADLHAISTTTVEKQRQGSQYSMPRACRGPYCCCKADFMIEHAVNPSCSSPSLRPSHPRLARQRQEKNPVPAPPSE